MSLEKNIVIEPLHEVPVLRTVDVLVAGGGPAGIAAGIAAAREGAKTLLIDRYGYLGGMITGAKVIWILGMGDGFRQKARGITQEIRERLEPMGAVTNPNKCGDYTLDPEVFKWQAVEMLEEAGAEVLLHTTACDPIIEDGCVKGIYTESKSGRRAILAKVVIDCTADADIAFRGGCEFDNETHDVTLGVTVNGIDWAKITAFEKEQPQQHEKIVAEARAINGGAMLNQTRFLKHIDITDAEALSDAEKLLRRDFFRALEYLKANLPGWENATIKETLPQLGVRQGRRIRGEYTMTDDDLRSSRHFDDSIARLGSYLLGYKLYDPAKLDYDISYRCMVPKGMDGLLIAGRSVSSDYLADNTLRLIVPCFATGQAAGAAAALATRQNVQPRDIDVKKLQDILRQQNVYLGGDPSTTDDTDESDDTPVQVWDGNESGE